MAGGDWMNMEETLREVLTKLDGLSSAAIVWTVAPAVLLLVLILMLIGQSRARASMDKTVRRLANEVDQLHLKLDAVQLAQRPRPRPSRPASPPHSEPAREAPRSGLDLVSVLNEMLAGHQPYNFVESIRALDPHLVLQRLTPSMDEEPFAQALLLENGGDGLFAHIDGDAALLFPNYSRFSATLDPKPLFDGAAHGGRIHALLRPAVLARTEDGRWQLIEKGRVQMRQGGENIG